MEANTSQRLNISGYHDGHKPSSVDASYLIQAGLPLLFNITVLLLILSRKKLFQEHSNKLFLNLQLVHIMLCITGIISKLHLCYFVVLISNGCLVELLLSLILITLDRSFKIRYPYKYEGVRTRRVICFIVTTWIISALFVILYVELRPIGNCRVILSTVLLGLASFSLTLTNISNYIIAKKHITFMRKYTINSNRKTKVAIKATYVCCSIVSLFVVSWCPLFVHNVMVLAHAYEPHSTKVFTEIVVRMAMLNSFIDPILFLCFTLDVKDEIRMILSRLENMMKT